MVNSDEKVGIKERQKEQKEQEEKRKAASEQKISESLDIDRYILGKTDQLWNETLLTDKHLLSIAPTRTGKGRGLILPNLLALPNHSVFVIDPKGENALVSARYRQSQGHEILIFNPYGIYADEFAARGFTQFQSFNLTKKAELITNLICYIKMVSS